MEVTNVLGSNHECLVTILFRFCSNCLFRLEDYSTNQSENMTSPVVALSIMLHLLQIMAEILVTLD